MTTTNISTQEVENADVRQSKISFETYIEPFYSEINMKILEERAANIESGKSVPKEHDLIEI